MKTAILTVFLVVGGFFIQAQTIEEKAEAYIKKGNEMLVPPKNSTLKTETIKLAIEEFNKAIQLSPRHVKAYVYRGIAKEKLKDLLMVKEYLPRKMKLRLNLLKT